MRKNIASRELLYSRCIKQPNGCIEWQGQLNTANGYGHIRIGGTKILVHRLSWELENGSIPDGLKIRHSEQCKKTCINPDHLKIGTQADNMQDAIYYDEMPKGKYPRGVTHHNDTGKYEACLYVKGKRRYIGVFSTPEEAHDAYRVISFLNELFPDREKIEKE